MLRHSDNVEIVGNISWYNIGAQQVLTAPLVHRLGQWQLAGVLSLINPDPSN
jgi:hypothetical protein